MTTSHAHTNAVATPLPVENRHLRLSDEAKVSHTQAGRFSVPLDLYEGAAKHTLLRLILTAEEAVDIHGQLGALIADKQGGGAA
ncbi:hypothetical protein ACFW81_28925 [Streptomyces angustmyceticus]|uniref:hypothetical protein n=1 Tax=Streptomyces angustmyceticus TaxID=285578 RepID=UPI0021AE357F|nr:hypothetical protein [Streptomyces angustmyceticus]